MMNLPSENARKIFHIRSGTIDLRGHRKYKYGENKSCRLCSGGTEDVNHVVNECSAISRQGGILDILTTDCDELLEVSKRCLDFDTQVDEAEES